jgi:hypothetical protein
MRDFFQAHVSDRMPKFKPGIMRRWFFDPYEDKTKPVVFFGVYSRRDIKLMNDHVGPKIIVFLGNDINFHGHRWKDDPNAVHISYGPFKKKLEDLGVRVYNHVTPMKDYSYWKPVPLGDKIYVYKGLLGKRLNHYKWKEVIEPLIEEFGDRVIWTDGKTEQQLKDDYYSKCFAYVKPNPIGGSTSMWELGHMGRRTFTQGHSDLGFDFTVNYSDVNDLIDKIKLEESRIGEIRSDVYEAATSSLCHSEDWLSTEYYEGW